MAWGALLFSILCNAQKNRDRTENAVSADLSVLRVC